jgi:hypothetical protein
MCTKNVRTKTIRGKTFINCEKEKDKANKRILRSLSFDNNGLVKPSCGTVALYGPFGFILRYGRLSMNNLG